MVLTGYTLHVLNAGIVYAYIQPSQASSYRAEADHISIRFGCVSHSCVVDKAAASRHNFAYWRPLR